MDKIRLGNDIEMRWSIFTRDGDNKVPYNLEGRALTLSVVNRTGESEIEFFAEGNIVTGVFRGRDQRILGKHGVILRENNRENGMRTIDACDAFELVACSCEEALGSSGTIQLFHLTFDSTIGAITGTIDPILNYEAEQAEAERKANEIIRKANEQQRIDNEKQRNVNEILRNIAEEERENAEKERIVNEDLRKADEAERKTNEESRLQSESERISSEEERLYAESIRVTNENARIASEAKRAEAETARIEAEDKRIVSEKARLSAESSRIANEDSRRANEDSRLSAEAKRVSAEEERQIAEEERQAEFASMVVQTTGEATDKVMSQKSVTEALKGKQNKLTAGKGISIDGDVISATLDMDIVRVVDALPSVGEANIIYLVPAEQPSESDLFEEWVWTDRWERIGSAKIDLSDYATKGYVDSKISSTEENLVHKDGYEKITEIKQFQKGIGVGLFNALVANEDSVQSGAWLDQNEDPAPFIVADPSADDHAATKYYVDEGLATKQDTLTDTDGGYGQRVANLEKEGIASQEKLTELEKDTVVLKDVSGNYETDANLIYHIKDAKSKTLFAISNKGEVVIPKFDSYTKHCIEDVIKETTDKQGINTKFIKMVNYSIPGMTIEMIKEIIDTMNSVNLNVFQFPLHNVILDDMTFHANGRVYDFSNIEMDAPITQNQFEELVNYARDRGVEILCDSIRVLTHANRLLDLFPELRYGNSNYDLNFSDKDAINVALAYAEKYASFAASVGCRYFHLDGDEFGIVPSNNRPYPEGYKYLHDRGEYDYMYLINKLSFMLKKYNMTSLVWNDPVCVNGINSPRLSDDIIVDYWENGNGMGGSPIGPKIIEDNGYKMINSKQELYWTYAEGGPKTTLDDIANYNPYKMAGGLVCKNVVGCKMNVWGDGATASDARYILDTTLPLVKAYGNRLLNLNL